MKSIKAKQLSKVQHLVPNNPSADLQLTKGSDWDAKAEAEAKKNTLYDAAYRTARGHWKQRDEPDEAEQFRQSDQIQQILRAQRQKASRERLKTKNAVPTRKGKKLFDEFMSEANSNRPSKEKLNINSRNLNDLENAYNAASALEFDQWVIFMSDLFGSQR
jgi:Fe-S cluster biosynthesis and repair protein YggX